MSKQVALMKKCKVIFRLWWREAHPRSKIGALITIFYLAIMLSTVFVKQNSFQKLELNALGDFLAGAFAPLALLWLVIGYFQQGDELRQNSQALLLQAKELRQTAEHAGGLLDVARKEHELAVEKLREQTIQRELAEKRQTEEQEKRRKYRIQPRLSFYMSSIEENGRAKIKMTNDGNDCNDFSIEIPDNVAVKLLNPIKPRKLEARDTLFIDVGALTRLGKAKVIARWIDADGDFYTKNFIVSVADNQIEIND